jgi:hypothetical protein
VGEPCDSYAGTPASEAFVAVTSPRPGAIVSGLVALGARTSARGDPTRVKWYLDGAEIGWARSGPPWSEAWNSASAREGRHRLFAKARIEGRGWETSRAIEVIVANRGAGAATQPSAHRPGAAPSCSMRRAAPATWQHVVWIVFENKQYSQVIGSPDAPYINALAGQCGLATNFSAEAHPSLPNYIAMTSGSPQGISDDSGPSAHPVAVPSIFSQLGGGGWRALQESMPANCALGNAGFYAVRHNPAAYYTNIRSDCAGYDVPLGANPDLSARFTFVTPDTCHDMHSSSCGSTTSSEVRNGDAWLAGFLPKLLASPQYQAGTTAVFITWDEDDYGGKQHIPTLVVAPSVRRGTSSARPFDHYSLLRTTEEMLKLRPFLGHAASAASMRRAFNL